MWVRRGRKDYFYRCRRRGSRVEREYLGSGPEAHLAAALDTQRLLERQARRDARRADRARWDSAAAVLSELTGAADLLARAALLGAGFHQHQRGAWRRRTRHD